MVHPLPPKTMVLQYITYSTLYMYSWLSFFVVVFFFFFFCFVLFVLFVFFFFFVFLFFFYIYCFFRVDSFQKGQKQFWEFPIMNVYPLFFKDNKRKWMVIIIYEKTKLHRRNGLRKHRPQQYGSIVVSFPFFVCVLRTSFSYLFQYRNNYLLRHGIKWP